MAQGLKEGGWGQVLHMKPRWPSTAGSRPLSRTGSTCGQSSLSPHPACRSAPPLSGHRGRLCSLEDSHHPRSGAVSKTTALVALQS